MQTIWILAGNSTAVSMQSSALWSLSLSLLLLLALSLALSLSLSLSVLVSTIQNSEGNLAAAFHCLSIFLATNLLLSFLLLFFGEVAFSTADK